MIVPLILIFIITTTNALDPKNENSDEIKNIILEHINKIPDIKEKYIMNNNMARSIARYLGGNINVLPLFKVSMKIDRNPVRIPWKLGEVITHHGNNTSNNNPIYRVHRVKKSRGKKGTTTAGPNEKEIEHNTPVEDTLKNETVTPQTRRHF